MNMDKIKNKTKNNFKTIVRRLKFLVVVAICGVLMVSLTGCGKNGPGGKGSTNGVVVDNQLAIPQKGERIAILTVQNYGTIKLRLFDQAAPKTVKHFIELAEAGAYNGLTFNEIVSDLKIQCGDDSEAVAKPTQIVEHNASLHNYNGAVGAAVDDDESNKQNGQFYIIFSEDGKRADFDYLQMNRVDYVEGKVDENEPAYEFSQDVRNNYRQVGGYPVFDMMKANIFAQVYSGMDVVEKIADCPKTSENMFEDPYPAEDIVIEKVEIKTFDGQV